MNNQLKSKGSTKEYLVQKGINPSFQRLKIFECILKSLSHPNVDMIYNELAKEIPTLSKTTIYNSLNIFQKRGIVMGLTIEENEVRYDSNTEPHGHFKCKNCSTIYDIPVEYPFLTKDFVCEHRVEEIHLYLKGICKKCQIDP